MMVAAILAFLAIFTLQTSLSMSSKVCMTMMIMMKMMMMMMMRMRMVMMMLLEENGNRGSNKKNPCEAEKLSLAACQVSPLVLNLRTHSVIIIIVIIIMVIFFLAIIIISEYLGFKTTNSN